MVVDLSAMVGSRALEEMVRALFGNNCMRGGSGALKVDGEGSGWRDDRATRDTRNRAQRAR